MAHQENENLDQKLHLPKMQNSVPVQSFALGAVIKRINYLTFYLALQHKLLDTLQNISPLYEIQKNQILMACGLHMPSISDCGLGALPVETVCEGLPQLDVVPPFA